ncbi:N-acetylmuramoyl-L-alanine amidase [Clostridium botulinum]|uniref:peptidoglycan recognition protein family protein n=1 Tax=Clostridium TaxID=1485 RepID=UPI0013F011E8|nr:MULTISPECIES: peptidoglycan recognition family protein [Clostridium]MBN1059884.1 N-acetylmuramoyl-L-alanine amidase [Clostridium botulinum]MBN1063030.1 N-acetylmuramoyl-L-alanine amidase [Clostridium botulinum]MBY6914942.1 N-acetylmuramoyl-L-alanine amidase [Clostridium botulinum]MCS6132162.1 N-acetylmuramoyl-L-alanine amidase [Clostridium botulinum]NFF81006.1 N-acetylmuramoyl-L-alanine amidase [Clostridium botulinum]
MTSITERSDYKNKYRLRHRNKSHIKYKIRPKEIEQNINKESFKNKLIFLLIGVVILSIVTGYLGKNRYVRFLNDNPYYEGNKVRISTLQKKLPSLNKELGIREIDYKWSGDLEYNNKPTLLVFHHTASSNLTPTKIHEMHMAKKWSGIGYHFYIRKDGTVYRGRPEEAIGAHIKGQNKNTLGICIEGNLEEEQPTEQEIEALEKLSTYLIIKYNIYGVQGHGDTYDTLCPGENFPMENVKQAITNEIDDLYNK